MKTALWQHQKDALEFSKTRQGVLLGHDPGVGKSLTALAICEREQAKRILVMCPHSVVGVWPEQVRKHCDVSYHVVRLDKGSVQKKTEMAALSLATPWNVIVVINHESAWREPFRSLALKEKWDVIILDEAHRAKQPSGKLSMFVALLAKKRPTAVRLALTGTPMPHSPLDVFGIIRFVDSGTLLVDNGDCPSGGRHDYAESVRERWMR